MYATTAEAAASLTWTITGEKGSLRFDGTYVNLQMVPPTLSRHRGGGDKGVWEIVEVKEALASGLVWGQVGELYYAFANGEKVKGCLVDFEGAALRHRMLDACFKSSRDGTRETYRK
jgi:predicted dehydrogenase